MHGQSCSFYYILSASANIQLIIICAQAHFEEATMSAKIIDPKRFIMWPKNRNSTHWYILKHFSNWWNLPSFYFFFFLVLGDFSLSWEVPKTCNMRMHSSDKKCPQFSKQISQNNSCTIDRSSEKIENSSFKIIDIFTVR